MFALPLVLSFAVTAPPSTGARPDAVNPARSDSISIGATVRDRSGAVIGRVESILTNAEGRPMQVVVRSTGPARIGARSRALPIDALRRDRDGYGVPLEKREFELLPPLKR